jgi:hypothetical protein
VQVIVTPLDASDAASVDALAERLGYTLDLDREGKDMLVRHLREGCCSPPRASTC